MWRHLRADFRGDMPLSSGERADGQGKDGRRRYHRAAPRAPSVPCVAARSPEGCRPATGSGDGVQIRPVHPVPQRPARAQRRRLVGDQLAEALQFIAQRPGDVRCDQHTVQAEQR